MRTVRLKLCGEKGNAFYILNTVRVMGREMGMDENEIKDIQQQMRGDVMAKLGGKQNDYNGLLTVYKKHFPFVELYSTVELPGVDPELYTLDEEPEIIEL